MVNLVHRALVVSLEDLVILATLGILASVASAETVATLDILASVANLAYLV